MYEDFAPKLAQVITSYSQPIEKDQLVVVMAKADAEPLVEALAVEILKRGGHPFSLLQTTNSGEIFFRNADDHQLEYLNPVLMSTIENIDVLLSIRSTTNPKALSNIDPERMQKSQVAQRPFTDLFLKREQAGELRWNICPWPTQAAAQDAEMGFLEYQEFVYKACALHHDDPVAYWREFKERQDKLCAWLEGKKHLEVRGPGIEMSLSIDGRTWINAHGSKNFPDGEIFTSPVEDSVNGHVEFNLPSVYGGRELSGIKLKYKDGKVVEASAEKGEDYLLSQLDADDGSRIMGEFAIGTNMGIRKFTREILFDEKMGGTIHMAVGLGFQEAGGGNVSVVHWDMVHDMMDGGEILVDGELFYKAGEFMVG